jgi:7-cyano-7-deazaguanine synthase
MKAIVLLSGGIDSTVVLALALSQNRECLGLSFDYGQRHRKELHHAQAIATHYKIFHKTITIDPSCFETSALVNKEEIPANRSSEEIAKGGIPSTYVPARNTLFLAFATGQAEIFNAGEIHCGPNLLDQNPYPDCRPEFYQAFQAVVNTATKQSVTGTPPQLVTPLINWDKKQIVETGRRLNAPLELTFSCYNPQACGEACDRCDACIIRNEALQFNLLTSDLDTIRGLS